MTNNLLCEACSKTLTGRQQRFCSDKCRMVVKRTESSVEPEQTESEQPGCVRVEGMVYNRPAITCSEFGSRPEPEQPDDKPMAGNRGRYRRLDGTEYQIDSVGRICNIRSGIEVLDCEPASLADYNKPDGRKYAKREHPEKLNWGEPMTFHELQASPFKANRVSIPGDWDYMGVAI